MRRRVLWLSLCTLLLLALAQTALAADAQRVVPSHTQVKLTKGDKFALSAFVLPEEADQRVIWKSAKPAVASVTAEGLVTARKAGVAVIRVSSAIKPNVFASVRVNVVKGVTPTGISLVAPGKKLEPGQEMALNVSVKPAAASQAVDFRSTNKEVATVTEEGVVRALSVGKTVISARSQVKTSVRATFTLTVYDPFTPQSVTIDEDSGYISQGESRALKYTIEPATARCELRWKSSAPAVVSITDEGVMKGLKAGRAKITCETVPGGLTDELVVMVINGARTQVIPARTTRQNAAAIEENLKAIDNIYASAVSELGRLSASGAITNAEFNKRRAILINAFSMYRFPWYTTTRVPYWTSAYAGKKDFYPDTVYYGLPYIQNGANNNRTNRRYNVEKALNQGFYESGSAGCYKLTSKRQANRYVGNDCSAFVGLSTFPANGVPVSSSVCYLITRDMLTSSAYHMITGYENLRPGDLLVKSGHTVMFLYYVDAAMTRMMIIEQGGGNLTTDIHNTVTCSVVKRSAYSSAYRIRRATFLSKR